MRLCLFVIMCALPLIGCDTRPDEFSARRAMEHQTHLPPVADEEQRTTCTILVQSSGQNAQTTKTQRVDANAHAPTADAHAESVDAAVATMLPVGNSGVSGQVSFKKVAEGIEVSGTLRKLSPGLHGFHVHEFGDISDLETGKSAGGHFNPTGHQHGARDAEQRHAGDFGNIEADSQGTADFRFVDTKISFNGPSSILGRGLVVHLGEDKFTQPVLEVSESAARCPRCNAAIDPRATGDTADMGFPTLDENSGRVEPETLPPPSPPVSDRKPQSK